MDGGHLPSILTDVHQTKPCSSCLPTCLKMRDYLHDPDLPRLPQIKLSVHVCAAVHVGGTRMKPRWRRGDGARLDEDALHLMAVTSP